MNTSLNISNPTIKKEAEDNATRTKFVIYALVVHSWEILIAKMKVFLILCAKVSKPNDPSHTVAILYCVKYKEKNVFFDGLPKRSSHDRGEQPPHHLYEINSTTPNTSSRKLLSCVS